MNQNEIKNLVGKGYKPCFFSGVRENGGVFNEKNGAWNENTGVFLHGVASIGDASFKSEITGRGESMCGYLFATKVANASEFVRLGIRSIVWYGDQGFEEVNARKTFTRGGAASTGAQAATGATPAASTAVASTAAPATGATGTAAPASVGTTPGTAPGTGAPATGADMAQMMGAFFASFAPSVAPAVAAQLMPKVQEMITEATKSCRIIEKFEIIHPDGGRTSGGACMHHYQYERILTRYSNKRGIQRNPVYMWGPAGTGKSTIAEQLAADLGLTFYGQSSLYFAHDLKGFEDGAGKFHDTPFFRAFTLGGLYFLDEYDNSNPQIGTFLNGAIANRWFDFPGVGTIKAHDDFYCIAAGNTAGNGPVNGYLRNQLDAANMDRFRKMKITYDPRIDEITANGNEDILTFVNELRRIYDAKGYTLLASPRLISILVSDLECNIPVGESVVDYVADMNRPTIEAIKAGFSEGAKNNPYVRAFLGIDTREMK
jgi:MoxR-like ATPase